MHVSEGMCMRYSYFLDYDLYFICKKESSNHDYCIWRHQYGLKHAGEKLP